MKQHEMRQVSYDTEVGKITTDYRVLDVRRPIWSLGSMMDSGCDVHFTKNRCWISKDDGNELDMIRSGGVFFGGTGKGTRCVRNPGSRCRSHAGR